MPVTPPLDEKDKRIRQLELEVRMLRGECEKAARLADIRRAERAELIRIGDLMVAWMDDVRRKDLEDAWQLAKALVKP